MNGQNEETVQDLNESSGSESGAEEGLRVQESRPSVRDIVLDCGVLGADGSVYRKATISKITGRDRKEIGSREVLKNGGKVISKLLFNRLDSVEGINLTKPDDRDRVIKGLLSADRSRLMLELYRLSKNTETISATVVCPSCEEEQELDFAIHDFPLRPFRNYVIDRQRNLFTFEVDVAIPSGVKAVFRYPNGYDEEATLPLLRVNPVEASHLMLSKCLLKYDGREIIERDFIDNLNVDELDALSEAFQEALPGIELSPEMRCFACGKEANVRVDVTDFFFGTSKKPRSH